MCITHKFEPDKTLVTLLKRVSTHRLDHVCWLLASYQSWQIMHITLLSRQTLHFGLTLPLEFYGFKHPKLIGSELT